MRSLAVDGRADAIMVNAVAPGAFTRMIDSFLADGPVKDQLRATAPAESVSPLYAWLAHDSCALSGELFGAVGGRVTRIFVGQTAGAGGLTTPETVRDRVAEILSEDSYWVPADSSADSQRWMQTLSPSVAWSSER
jgi:NAD(P)-dependent dehydrogenase (short-subunit alcohol dehydrogenase family)